VNQMMTCTCGYPFEGGDEFCANCGDLRALSAPHFASRSADGKIPSAPPNVPRPVAPQPRVPYEQVRGDAAYLQKTLRHRLVARRWVRIPVLVMLVIIVISGLLTPFISSQLTQMVKQRIAAQLAVPGSPAPQVTVEGGWIVSQLLSGRLTEIHASLSSVTMDGVQHASITITLRGVSLSGGTDHADSIDVAAELPFASLPALTKASFARASDGLLAVTAPSNPKLAADQVTKVFVKLELAGNTLTAYPQGMLLFGRMLPASTASSVAGGSRVTRLPALPAGLAYQSVTPESSGLHIALGGTSTTPLSALPASVGGRIVSYTASNGLLGISTKVSVLVTSIPLTIWAQPVLTGDTLTLIPRSVQLLGENRPSSDPLAELALSQVSQSQLTRKLPTLPAGVNYRSVSVDSQGIHVSVGGVIVRPFSSLPESIPGAVFSAQNGLLVATVKGEPANARPTTTVMLAQPAVSGGTLVLRPERFIILGTVFSASDVMSQIKIPGLRYSLPALPAHMAYTGVDVLSDGLLLEITGKNVTLTKNMFGSRG
jgi:LmeA-like phospholipid-binding